MKFVPTFSSRHLLYVKDCITDRGADPNIIFDTIGLDLNNELDQNKPIPVATFARLLDVAAHHLGDNYFGMRVGQDFHYASSGLMILATISAPSLEAGLKTLVRYDRHFDSCIDLALTINAENFELSLSLIDPFHTVYTQLNEYLMTLILQLLRAATRKDIRAEAVYFQHTLGKETKPLMDFFTSPLHFGFDCNKFVFDNALLKEKFITTHQQLYDILTKAIQNYASTHRSGDHELVDIVCREIIKQTAKEAPDIETVASGLSMSVRSLRRHLSEEGSSFQEIKKLACENQAKYLLAQTTMSQAEIAHELGYSEVSAFSRAFRSWTGETPQAYRDKHGDVTAPPNGPQGRLD